jgi:outer membrane protein assembly factor BamB
MIPRPLSSSASALAALLLLSPPSAPPPLAAADWPEFQGAGRRIAWEEDGLVDAFGPGDLVPMWSVPVAAGYSGPTVARSGVYVFDRPDPASERVLCLDRETGATLWERAYPCRYENVDYAYGPRASVTVAGERAFSFGTMGHLHAFHADTGELLWARDLGADYRIDLPIWGLAASPLAVDGLLVVMPGAREDGAAVIALDQATGEEVWRAVPDRVGYTSPLLVEQAGRTVLVVWTADRLAGMDPASGEVHWEIPTPPQRMPISVPTPALDEDGSRLFLSSFYDGSRMVGLARDRLAAELLLERRGINERNTDALHAMISQPFLEGGRIYGIDSYGQARCLDAANGDRLWEDTGLVTPGRWATVFWARQGGRVWMVNEEGELLLARLGPDGCEVVSRAPLIEPTTPLGQRESGAVLWTPPAFADRSVYVKNDRELIRVSLAAQP